MNSLPPIPAVRQVPIANSYSFNGKGPGVSISRGFADGMGALRRGETAELNSYLALSRNVSNEKSDGGQSEGEDRINLALMQPRVASGNAPREGMLVFLLPSHAVGIKSFSRAVAEAQLGRPLATGGPSAFAGAFPLSLTEANFVCANEMKMDAFDYPTPAQVAMEILRAFGYMHTYHPINAPSTGRGKQATSSILISGKGFVNALASDEPGKRHWLVGTRVQRTALTGDGRDNFNLSSQQFGAPTRPTSRMINVQGKRVRSENNELVDYPVFFTAIASKTRPVFPTCVDDNGYVQETYVALLGRVIHQHGATGNINNSKKATHDFFAEASLPKCEFMASLINA